MHYTFILLLVKSHLSCIIIFVIYCQIWNLHAAYKARMGVVALIDDETLYRQYLAGNESGLESLMERYGNSLTFYINGYIHDIHDAEDLMIETFARMILKHPNIRDGCFKSYLYKIARHLALRFLAKNKLNCCFDVEILNNEQTNEMLAEEVVRTKERDHILHMCMEQLNPVYREALYLVYFESMCHAEAAAIMRKSEKQVADLLYRGKKSLQKRLEQEGVTNAEY